MIGLDDVFHVLLVAVVGRCAVVKRVEVRMRVQVTPPFLSPFSAHFDKFAPVIKVSVTTRGLTEVRRQN